MNEINAAICEKVFGWSVDRETGTYSIPDAESGRCAPCPDFLVSAKAQELLRAEMRNRGFSLKTTTNPVNTKESFGKTFTAVFTRGNERFDQTETEENLAVCRAALKAFGRSSNI